MKQVKAAIADDSAIVRSRLAEKIRKLQGIDVIWQANDAFESIKLFGELKPDVFILDVQMPGMTGIEMLKEIKALENPDVTFIVLTNYPLPILKKKSIDAGADYFFDKTTEFDKVVDIIKNIKVQFFNNLKTIDTPDNGKSNLGEASFGEASFGEASFGEAK